jgi:ABC-type transporter Mla MlaB component
MQTTTTTRKTMERFKQLLESTVDLDKIQSKLRDNSYYALQDILVDDSGFISLQQLIKTIKTKDKNLARTIQNLSNKIQTQIDLYDFEFGEKLKALSQEKEFDLHYKFDVEESEDNFMIPLLADNGKPDMDEVENISDFLKKNNKSLFKIFDDVWNKNYIDAGEITDISDAILEL